MTEHKDLDDESSLIENLILKFQKLLSKKRLHKQKLSKLIKSFENLKLQFSSVTFSNEKLSHYLKASLCLTNYFVKIMKENKLLSK